MKKITAFCFVFAALALVACGGDDDEDTTTGGGAQATTAPAGGGGGGGGGGETLTLTADPGGAFQYDTDQLDAKAGSVTIELDNPAAVSHDVTIEDSGGSEVAKSDLIAQDTTSVTTELQPGEYTFYCSVPGHREGGMEGTLTVK